MRSQGDVEYWGETFNKQTYLSGYQSNHEVFDKHGWRPTKNLKGSNKHTEYREEFTDMDLKKKLSDVQGGRSVRPYKKKKKAKSVDSTSSKSDKQMKNGFNLPTYKSKKGVPTALAIHRFESDSNSSDDFQRPSTNVRKRRDYEMQIGLEISNKTLYRCKLKSAGKCCTHKFCKICTHDKQEKLQDS
jgi:hypothetical protein